jgi:acyl-coenzyme A synthetase/AMP-(fatty) acid ligase
MATTIDDIASSDPQRPWISVPRDDDDLTKGFIDITFKRFSNEINHAAAWLESCLGPTTGCFDTFAYEGPKDARAYIITVAAVKVGRKVSLPY